MKIDPVSTTRHPLAASISPGIYPYLGGSVHPDLLRSVVKACGGAVVSGRQGAPGPGDIRRIDVGFRGGRLGGRRPRRRAGMSTRCEDAQHRESCDEPEPAHAR